MLVNKLLEPFARSHQQRWHSEALQMYGERVIVRHRWNIQDYALGRVGRCSACAAGVRLNEQQRVRIINGNGGTFTLTFAGQETDPLPFNASTTQVKAALEALEVNSPGDVVATGDIQHPGMVLEFRGKWTSREDIPPITYDSSLLNAGASVEVLQIRQGSGGANVQDRVSNAYKQSGDSWCTSCFGVGFEGGFEPIVYVTMAIIGDQQAETTYSKSGAIQKTDPKASFSFEPPVQEFDLVARVYEWDADGVTPLRVAGRYMVREVEVVTVRTGPGSPDDSIAVLPENMRTTYANPRPDWVVGQETQLEVLPYEHSWNLVPLSRAEEVLVEEGILQSRKWYQQAGAEMPLKVRSTHP